MQTDNQIIESILNGDIQSYRHLVNKYKDMAYTVALKLMKDNNNAEEIAQESFIKAYEKLDSYKGDASFSTWLYTIVYRTAIYHLRKSKPIEDLERSNYHLESTAGSISDKLERHEIAHQIKHAINKLPKLEALVITLYYIDQKSTAEISKITDLSKANIKVKLFRARKKLRNLLKPNMING